MKTAWHIPNAASGRIRGDPFGRTYAELDHWYRSRGTSLRQQCVLAGLGLIQDRKAALITLANAGGRRPRQESEDFREAQLGQALSFYTNGQRKNTSFDRKIRKLRPDWFVHAAVARKEKLLKLAHGGAKRSTLSIKDRAVLRNYTVKGAASYDPVFTKKIRELRPDWLETRTTTLARKKAALLQSARNGTVKPKRDAKDPAERQLAQRLGSYLHRDPAFKKEISRLRPDWLGSADAMKKMLLRLVYDGKKKPARATTVGAALHNYTVKSCGSYDRDFDAEIRRARPDWFSYGQRGMEQRRQLLDLARNGAERPLYRELLGRRLSISTNPASAHYDPAFDEKIRRLRSDWFTQ